MDRETCKLRSGSREEGQSRAVETKRRKREIKCGADKEKEALLHEQGLAAATTKRTDVAPASGHLSGDGENGLLTCLEFIHCCGHTHHTPPIADSWRGGGGGGRRQQTQQGCWKEVCVAGGGWHFIGVLEGQENCRTLREKGGMGMGREGFDAATHTCTLFFFTQKNEKDWGEGGGHSKGRKETTQQQESSK